MRSCVAFAAGTLAAFVLAAAPAFAQKQGGTLRIYHRDNPPSASIHEEATISTVQPFMAVFNNLVVFDQREAAQQRPTPSCPTWPTAGPGTPTNTKLTFKLRRASNGTTASRSRPRTCSAPGTS